MADAQYAIDVAAAMPGGEKTIADLDALTQNLLGAGVGADALHDAVALATNALNAAKEATTAANAALAAGNQEFRSLEQAALQAAKAEEKAAKLGVVPPEVAASVRATSAALEAHTAKLEGLEVAAQQAGAKERDLARALGNVKQAAQAGASAFKEQEEAVKKAEAAQLKATKTAEELTGTTKWRKLNEAMGSSEGRALLAGRAAAIAATAFVGLSVALAAVTLAAVAGVVAITNWAIGLADAKRNAGLADAAAEALGANVAGLSGLFAELNAETGLSNGELSGLTKRLREAGVPAGALAGALRDAALAERAMGKGGADDLISDIKASKGAITGFSNEVRGKLGVIVSKQMMGLDAQTTRLKKNFGELFGGLNIDPVLSGLQRLVSLFDQTTVAGETIKFLFESVFGPLIANADKAALAVEAFALGFLIGLTKLYILIKPTIRALGEFFGFDDTSLTDLLDSAKSAGEVVAFVFAGFIATVGVLTVAVLALGAALLLPIVALAALTTAVIIVGVEIVQGIMNAWTAVTDYLNGLAPRLGDIAGDMMLGLINGVLGGGPAVLSAITGVVGGAIDAAKKLLGIASPSKVFADMGMNTGEGFAMGVDDSAADAQASMAAMVAPPEASTIGSAVAGSQPGAAGGGARGGWSGNLIVNMHGVSGAEEATQRFEEIVTRIWKGDAAQLGAGAAP